MSMTAFRIISIMLVAAAIAALGARPAPLRADDAEPTPTVAEPLQDLAAGATGVEPLQDLAAGATGVAPRVFLPLVVGLPPDPLRQLELDFIRLLNEERRRRGLQTVVEDPRLSAYNRDVHARVIAERIRTLGMEQGCQHRTGAGPVPRRWIIIGDALACNTVSPEQTLEGLLNSPPHRGIILHPDADIVGVGVGEIRPGAYVFVIIPAFTPLPRERIETLLLETVQEERARLGGAPFAVNEKLMRAARRIAQRLAAEPHNVSGDLAGFLPCHRGDPRPDADAEGYAGQTAEEYVPTCFYHPHPWWLKEKLRIRYADDRVYGSEMMWRTLYDPRWRAVGVGAAYAVADPWDTEWVFREGWGWFDLKTDDVVVVVLAGDDPNR